MNDIDLRDPVRPFLTIITRCHPVNREKMLERNKQSVIAQTDQDLEHVFIKDAGKDILEANQSFARVVDTIRGEYIFILDDDDYLIVDNLTSEAKKVASRDSPDVIMLKMRRTMFPKEKSLPDGAHWEKKPAAAKLCTSSFMVKREIWKEYIWAFGLAPECGNFRFIVRIWDAGYKFSWLDLIASEVDSIGSLGGFGAGER